MNSGTRRLALVVNRVGRKGVPAPRSFETWVRAALRGSGRIRPVTVALVGGREARALNRRFRGKDYATNVLSFAYEPLPGETAAPLGDLVLCPSVIAREARRQGKRLSHHYAHLTIHGVLHLLGHDHQTARQAQRMEALETQLLAGLGIPDPYR
jgi:probable rRNA maturation factor